MTTVLLTFLAMILVLGQAGVQVPWPEEVSSRRAKVPAKKRKKATVPPPPISQFLSFASVSGARKWEMGGGGTVA